jgi:hypothetical protein
MVPYSMGVASMSRRPALVHEAHRGTGVLQTASGAVDEALLSPTGQVRALFEAEGTGHNVVSLLYFHTRLPR